MSFYAFSKNKIKSLQSLSCEQKNFFDSEFQAQLEIDARLWKARPYECFFCPGWHITSNKSPRRDRKDDRRFRKIYEALAKHWSKEQLIE